MRNFNMNNRTQSSVVTQNPEIERADLNCREAELGVKNAIQELGKSYFEANKDNTEAEYYEQIIHIKKCMDDENLWHQYRLSLEDKTQCVECGAIITSNSRFCNLCGSSIQGWDFSGLGVGNSVKENAADKSVCRQCGKPLTSGAAFCETCGARV